MSEIWKDIKDYEGFYQVSNLGNIRSVDRMIKANAAGAMRLQKGKIKKPSLKDGYLKVCLYKDNQQKNYYVHRLVAEAFIPNPDNLPQINHKDEDKTNNTVENLEWCSNEYNTMYGTRGQRQGETLLNNGKTSTRVIKCDLEGHELAFYRSMREAERENNLANGSISAYFRKGYSQVGGFTWKKSNIIGYKE